MLKVVTAAAAAGAAVFSLASANESEAFCVEFASGNGWDTEPCACVGEVMESDAGVKAEILGFSTAEDVEGMSESTKEAISACFPQE